MADGFTSIIDLAFRENTLLVAELDEASWLGLETGQGIGGTLNACNAGTWNCAAVATNVMGLTAVTVANDGTITVVRNGAIPGAAQLSTVQ